MVVWGFKFIPKILAHSKISSFYGSKNTTTNHKKLQSANPIQRIFKIVSRILHISLNMNLSFRFTAKFMRVAKITNVTWVVSFSRRIDRRKHHQISCVEFYLGNCYAIVRGDFKSLHDCKWSQTNVCYVLLCTNPNYFFNQFFFVLKSSFITRYYM